MAQDQKSKPTYRLPNEEQMLEAGVHFGHQARRWHPKMESYIFDKRKGIHILDLYKSKELLEVACNFLYETAARGGSIVFVGTKKQAKDIIELEARRAGAMYMSDRWIGGTITNFPVIKKNIDKLKDFMRRKEDGSLARYTKKERLLIDREVEKLRKSIGGILPLTSKPDALFVVDVKREKTAIREAIRTGIPVVALVDTNSDPTGVSYVIPGNDDAIRSIALLVKVVADSVEAGYQEAGRVKAAQLKEKAEEAEAAKAVSGVETKPVEKPAAKVEAKAEKKVEKTLEITETKKAVKKEAAKEVKEVEGAKKRGRPAKKKE